MGLTPSKYPRVSLDEQALYLREVLERLSRGSGQRRIVFDLDGTLVDNRTRSVAIMRELADTWSTSHPAAARILRSLGPESFVYLIEDSLENAGLEDHALVDQALEFWSERFFRDEYIAHDRSHPGAVAFASACYDAGATLVYFTGRDIQNMAVGSFASLRDLGFPIGVARVELVLKPDPEIPDKQFKLGVTPELGREASVVATFENEPGHCNLFREHFPQALHFLVDTHHFPDAPALDEQIRVVRDFRMD